MHFRVKTYIAGVATAALLSLILLAFVAPSADQVAMRALVALSTFALAAELFGYNASSGARGTMLFFPFAACLLLAPTALTVVSFAIVTAVAHAIIRAPARKIFFNVAQMLLSGSLGTLAFLALGGTAMLVNSGRYIGRVPVESLPAIAGLIVTFLITNSLAVYGVIAIDSEKPIFQSWRAGVRRTFGYDVFLSPIAYVVAWVFLRYGLSGVFLLSIPLLVVRQVYKTNHLLEKVNHELLELMVKAIEARDPYTSGHSRRVSQYSRIIGRAVGVTGGDLERVAVAALLHDVGKIHEAYAPILRKPEKLNPAEWAVMQTHPIKSAELVSTVSHLKDIVAPVRHHHENWDGTGYPDGLQGEQIPIGSRIVLFADTIDAMTTDRPYRKALTEAQVRSELVKFRGKQFDPNMCDKLLASPMFGLLFAPHQRETTPEHSAPVLGPRVERAAVRS